jgi:hypothetical protein
VKYLPHGDIKASALRLLAEYGRKFGPVERPPIPVDEILEAHLELQLGFDDLPKRLGVPDVLGATWVRERKVAIDQSLDPTVHPSKEGRYRFTVAHEIGHWELHRHVYQAGANQPSLFDAPEQPSIVCRARSGKDRQEWQADTFSGYLLMPEDMVYLAWEERFGSLEPYVAVDEIADLSAKWGLGEDDHKPTVAAARELARVFQVSGQAMQIRLAELGLICTQVPAPDLFSHPGTTVRS